MNAANNKGSKKVKYGSGAYNSSKKMQRYESDIEMMPAGKKKNKKTAATSAGGNNKIWMAALAGASAGVIAGLLMAPESGRDTMESLKKSALRLGDQMDETFRTAMRKLEDMGITRTGDSLQIQGNWDKVKGMMKSEYGDLTDQDLTYIEGKEDTFLGNLETKLGKSKRELITWINSLA